MRYCLGVLISTRFDIIYWTSLVLLPFTSSCCVVFILIFFLHECHYYHCLSFIDSKAIPVHLNKQLVLSHLESIILARLTRHWSIGESIYVHKLKISTRFFYLKVNSILTQSYKSHIIYIFICTYIQSEETQQKKQQKWSKYVTYRIGDIFIFIINYTHHTHTHMKIYHCI